MINRRHGNWIPLVNTTRNRAKEYDEGFAEVFMALPTTMRLFQQFNYEPECDSEIRCDTTKLALYLWCRNLGVQPVYAAMRACRRGPSAKHMDRHFNEGARRRMNEMGQKHLDKIVRMAQKSGISTQGKFYVGGLGRYTDPQAWCSTIDDVLDTAKRKNLEMTGVAEHRSVEMPPPKKTALAPDIMQRYVKQYLKNDPGLAQRVKKQPKAMRDLKERIVATHARKSVGV